MPKILAVLDVPLPPLARVVAEAEIAHAAASGPARAPGRDDRAHNRALAAQLDTFVRSGGRVIVVGRHPYPADAVLPDNVGGARALMNAILARGHRDIAIISGPPELTTTRDRLEGFRLAFADHGLLLDPATIVDGAQRGRMPPAPIQSRLETSHAAPSRMQRGSLDRGYS